MSEPAPDTTDVMLLPRGWARFLLLAVALLLLGAWWLGAHATPPDFDRANPTLPSAPAPPPPVPD